MLCGTGRLSGTAADRGQEVSGFGICEPLARAQQLAAEGAVIGFDAKTIITGCVFEPSGFQDALRGLQFRRTSGGSFR